VPPDSKPLLAAALIVRDEAEALPACLESLAGIVDEIHVHDTGSTDGTPDIAARFGAVVTGAPWTDDFAAARNAAQQGWTADWVLAIDADNRLVADRRRLRQLLLAAGSSDTLLVDIDNAHDETPYIHREARLYRPGRVTWQGRVHERLVRPDGADVRVGDAPRDTISLRHLGYADPAVRAAKAHRNVSLAQASVDELVALGDQGDPVQAACTLLDLGRSLVSAQRQQDAVDTFETLRELFPGTPQWLQATDFLARLTLAAGMYEVCLVLTDQLRAAGARSMYCDWLAAQALAQLGDAVGADELLGQVTQVVDTAGRRYDIRALEELRGLVGQLRQLEGSAAGNRGGGK
jgi:hypothetical protein